MKIVSINTVQYGSTGKIMLQIADLARSKGHEVYTYSKSWTNKYRPNIFHNFIGTVLENFLYRLLAPITGREDYYECHGTNQLVDSLRKIKPDIIHLHNLHGYYINYQILFNFIKEDNIPVVWTLHDCWAFTGHCPYFELVNCNKWQSECNNCPQLHVYPKLIFDKSKECFKIKKEIFTGVNSIMLVTPTVWLASLVKKSFLKDYPIQVINNGIDLNIFRPTQSSFRDKYNLNDKKIILGVAFDWGIRKGLDIFTNLVNILPENYQIVLVGTDKNIEKRLHRNIISIHKTNNQMELAEIYSVADVFVNPTREEVMGTVNLESLACGTPVITFNTGGSPECIDEYCGCVVEKEDLYALKNEIISVCETKRFTLEACLNRAKMFDMNKRFEEYVKLYEELYASSNSSNAR